VISAIPDRSSSRSRSAKSAMNPTSHTAATDLPASAAARAGSGGDSAAARRRFRRRRGCAAGAARPRGRPDRRPEGRPRSLGVPGQCLDPAALPVPAAGQLQQRRGPVGRPAEPGSAARSCSAPSSCRPSRHSVRPSRSRISGSPPAAARW
jgi:hypothetical protein